MFTTSYTAPRRNQAAWLCSAAVHIVGALLLVQFGGAILAPPAHRPNATLIYIPPSTPDIPEPVALPKPKLRALKLPKLPPPAKIDVARKPVLIEAPEIRAAQKPEIRPVPAIQAPPPPPQVRTGVLHSPQLAAPPQARPTPAVQTGTFSQNLKNEPKSAPRLPSRPAGFDGGIAPGQPQRNAALIAQSAGFETGSTEKMQNEPNRVASVGGFGGAVTLTSTPGPARHTSVSAGGFGSAQSGTPGPSRTQQQTARTGFGDTVVAKNQPAPTRTAAPEPQPATPVEITFKPKPAYTEEARRLQIEGEVVIEAVFAASGQVEILRIIRGLGHGLNESAIAAVRAIRFRPAMRRGQPVDSTATVRMNFELAY